MFYKKHSAMPTSTVPPPLHFHPLQARIRGLTGNTNRPNRRSQLITRKACYVRKMRDARTGGVGPNRHYTPFISTCQVQSLKNQYLRMKNRTFTPRIRIVQVQTLFAAVSNDIAARVQVARARDAADGSRATGACVAVYRSDGRKLAGLDIVCWGSRGREGECCEEGEELHF